MNNTEDVDLFRLLGEQLVTIRAQAQKIKYLEALNNELVAEREHTGNSNNLNAVPLPVKNFGKEGVTDGQS